MNCNVMTIEQPYTSVGKRRLFLALLLAAVCFGSSTAQGPLQLSMSFTPPTCNGDSDGTATATPSGGTAPYTYQWSNNHQTATIQNLSAGT